MFFSISELENDVIKTEFQSLWYKFFSRNKQNFVGIQINANQAYKNLVKYACISNNKYAAEEKQNSFGML